MKKALSLAAATVFYAFAYVLSGKNVDPSGLAICTFMSAMSALKFFSMVREQFMPA